jgi:hypothetical protein
MTPRALPSAAGGIDPPRYPFDLPHFLDANRYPLRAKML